MVQPQEQAVETAEEIQRLFSCGLVLGSSSELALAKMRRNIKNSPSMDSGEQYLHLAEIATLAGKFDEASELGKKAMAASGNNERLQISSLYVHFRIGRFQDALAESRHVDFTSPACWDEKLRLAAELMLLERLEDIRKTGHRINAEEEYMALLDRNAEAIRALSGWGVTESAARDLFEKAGRFVTSRGYLIARRPIMRLDVHGNLVWYELPLSIPYAERRALSLEWEEELFTKHLDAPIQYLHVHFVDGNDD